MAGDVDGLETDKARSAPRIWALKHDRWSFLLMEYSGKSMFPFLSKNDKGLYFIQDPNNSMGWLAPSRMGMAQALGHLLSSLDGGEARISRNVEVALVPPQPRAATLVSAGKWAVEWRAVPPIAPFYFPLGEYPRLMHKGKPATLKDLEEAGIGLERKR